MSCNVFSPQHFDLHSGMNDSCDAILSSVCWEFVLGLIIVLIVTWILEPPCFAVWIVIVGSYLVVAVLLKMICITTFGVMFSLLYLIDRALAINLECPKTHHLDPDDE